MSTFTTGDTAPPLTGSVNANLTGATVTLHLRKPGQDVLTKAATITDPAAGEWSCAWAPGDLDEPGTWRLEAQVTFSGNTVQTFGPATFKVTEQIA